MPLRIITDSSTTIPEDYLSRLGILEVPAVINFGHESFLKTELTLEEVYRRIEAAPQPPTTAQPSPRQFVEAYEHAAREGADEIIAVIVSSRLSGTMNSAQMAVDSSPVPVHLWDCKHVSMAAGWQAIAAAEMVQQGMDAKSVLNGLAGVRNRVQMVFSPANLRYIIASGRVPRLRGTIGDLLNIKPVMETVDGLLEPVTQVRSQRRAQEAMVERAVEFFGDKRVRLAVGHCNVPDQAAALFDAASARLNIAEGLIFDLGVVLAALAGPGLLGITGYALEDQT